MDVYLASNEILNSTIVFCLCLFCRSCSSPCYIFVVLELLSSRNVCTWRGIIFKNRWANE